MYKYIEAAKLKLYSLSLKSVIKSIISIFKSPKLIFWWLHIITLICCGFFQLRQLAFYHKEYFSDVLFLSVIYLPAVPFLKPIVQTGPVWPRNYTTGLKLLLYLWNEQDMLYYESFPVIGDFCSKPFGQFSSNFDQSL